MPGTITGCETERSMKQDPSALTGNRPMEGIERSLSDKLVIQQFP